MLFAVNGGSRQHGWLLDAHEPAETSGRVSPFPTAGARTASVRRLFDQEFDGNAHELFSSAALVDLRQQLCVLPAQKLRQLEAGQAPNVLHGDEFEAGLPEPGHACERVRDGLLVKERLKPYRSQRRCTLRAHYGIRRRKAVLLGRPGAVWRATRNLSPPAGEIPRVRGGCEAGQNTFGRENGSFRQTIHIGLWRNERGLTIARLEPHETSAGDALLRRSQSPHGGLDPEVWSGESRERAASPLPDFGRRFSARYCSSSLSGHHGEVILVDGKA
jgi:hypothetical protein